MPYEPPKEILRDGNLLYQLNSKGTNIWCAGVQQNDFNFDVRTTMLAKAIADRYNSHEAQQARIKKLEAALKAVADSKGHTVATYKGKDYKLVDALATIADVALEETPCLN